MKVNDTVAKRPSAVTVLLFSLNSLLDSEDQRDILDFDETRREISNGNTVGFLQRKFGDLIDWSIHSTEIIDDLNKRMANLERIFGVDMRAKAGIENNGLCLLMAYGIEILQDLFFK